MCTAGLVPSAHGLLLGHNYDFYFGHGLAVVNRRGLRKRALQDGPGQGMEWTSRFGSLTANQFAMELPVCGLNEAGLALAMLWHEDGRLPAPDGRPALNELQWIQYQLDTCGSVAEVLDRLEQVRIEAQMFTLHYLLSDAGGDAALVEFEAGRPEIVRRPRPAVLSNSSYARSVQHARLQNGVPIASLPHSANSLDRFVLADRLVSDLSRIPATAEQVFGLLEALAIRPSVGGLARWLLQRTPPSTTQWTTVIDPTLRKLYWRGSDAAAQWQCSLQQIDFDGRRLPRVMDLRESGRGEVADRLRPFRTEDNLRIIHASFGPVRDRFPEAAQEELAAYPETFFVAASTDSVQSTTPERSAP